MNIVGANSSRGGHYPSQYAVYGGKVKASTLVTTVDPPQRYKKRYRRRSPKHLTTDKPSYSSNGPRTAKAVSYGRNSSFIREKLQFHREETFSDPVGRGQKVDGLSEKHYLRAVKQSRSCLPPSSTNVTSLDTHVGLHATA